MPRLTEEQKAANRFDHAMENCKSMDIGKYNGYTAKIFQEVIRAEAAGFAGNVAAVVDGKFQSVYSPDYHVVCVTCGGVFQWGGTNQVDTGHFVPGRRPPNLLLDDHNVHPQCKTENMNDGSADGAYELYMINVYGQEEVDRLRGLRNDTWWQDLDRLSRQEWAVGKRLEFLARRKAALKELGL